MSAEATTGNDLNTIAILIPAWKPDEKLIALVDSLLQHPFAAIVVVNDGSAPEFDSVFDALRPHDKVRVLRHRLNCGQGRAQKTAFHYALTNLPNLIGVVTADADGQHAPNDIVRVAELLARSDGSPVLGMRTFAEGVPFRSKFGNNVTRYFFKFLSGRTIKDTQCGLRGFPVACLPGLLNVRGERFEFASSVLAYLCREQKQPFQTPIATIYLDENRSSHFKPVQDSIRIYSLLLSFYAASIAAICADLATFAIVVASTGSIVKSIAAGRLLLLAGYAVNKRCAVQPWMPSSKSFLGYALALVGTGVVSLALTLCLHQYLGWNALAAKMTAETILVLAVLARR